MKKHDLLKSDATIIRVLDIQLDKILIIDCIERTMPVWIKPSVLASYSVCSIEALNEAVGFTIPSVDTLDAEQKKTMYDRYTLIAPILPFISDDKMRSHLIASMAAEHNVSKQTVRSHLCMYLAYMDIAALAPQKQQYDDVELTQDEKNIRWALNKFFYTTQKQSLSTAYTMMLKEKYCDSMGTLAEAYPSFYQFRYFYRKTKNMQNYYISRDGLKNYQRNNRPLIGEGVQQFAPAIGVGMLDATVCDIYLVNDAGNLVGRPILTACIDAYSGLCCGYALSWEGGVYSLRGLMLNIIADMFLDTFIPIIPFGDFYKKDKAAKIIWKEVKDNVMKRKMLRLLALIPEKKSLYLAQKAMDCRNIEKVMDAFAKINLSPVTISKRQDVKHLENLYSYFLDWN